MNPESHTKARRHEAEAHAETRRRGEEKPLPSDSGDRASAPPRAISFRVRSGQVEFERGVDAHRITGLITRRQYGKTTIAARLALKKMMRTPGHTVVFGSVKLDLGREIVRKESEALQRAFRTFAGGVQRLEISTPTTNKNPYSFRDISADDFAELYEAQRLEFRLWHDRTTYSRTKVVALTPSSVGETGDLILDEVGRVRAFREVWEAVKPIISSNPAFRCLLTTTPPPDDAHYSYELLAPPVADDYPVNPLGNWYQSELGVHILRVTAWDAAADGVPLYDDDTGAPITPEESRAKDHDKDAWDRNYGCKFVVGGTAACGLIPLDTAQRRGVGQCAFFQIQEETDFDRALAWLHQHLGDGQVGIGYDVATTTKGTSNPSSVAVVERVGNEYFYRLVVAWKTPEPRLAIERLRRILGACHAAQHKFPRRLCVDATSERYFAAEVRDQLAGLVPVDLVVASETIERSGFEPMTLKQWLGSQLVAALEDNHLILPPERWLREDWRLVRKEKGQFTCEPDANGRHGDTFDAAKLALHAHLGRGEAIDEVSGFRFGNPRM